MGAGHVLRRPSEDARTLLLAEPTDDGESVQLVAATIWRAWYDLAALGYRITFKSRAVLFVPRVVAGSLYRSDDIKSPDLLSEPDSVERVCQIAFRGLTVPEGH